MKASIDLSNVESFFLSREDDESDYTETNVQMCSGDSFTVKIPYEAFKEILLKEIAK